MPSETIAPYREIDPRGRGDLIVQLRVGSVGSAHGYAGCSTWTVTMYIAIG